MNLPKWLCPECPKCLPNLSGRMVSPLEEADRREKETERTARREAHKAYMRESRALKKASEEQQKAIAAQRKRELGKARMRKFRAKTARRQERTQYWRDHENRVE